MLSIVTNPRGVDGEYLRKLNICFAGAWNESSYRWYLKRPFRSMSPDVLAVRDCDDLVAGMGINYRQLALSDGSTVDVAVLTAAWSLPEYRGRWQFSRLIEASKVIARERGCVAALAFVTADNASAVVLRRAGAWSVPTRYLFAYPDKNPITAGRLPNLIRHDFFPKSGPIRSPDSVEFAYGRTVDWRSQILDRPNPTSSWLADGRRVVLEHTATTDRLQYVSGTADYSSIVLAFALRARKLKRTFFHATTRAEVAHRTEACGLTVREGYIKILDLIGEPDSVWPRYGRSALLEAAWRIQAGDRM